LTLDRSLADSETHGPLMKEPPPLPTPGAQPKKSADGRYLRYEDVPWYRREPSMLAGICVLFCGLATIALCVICLTGDVYKKTYDKDGKLMVWGIGNKIAAVVILIIQAFLAWVWHWTGNMMKSG
jgi:hypothetical protein